MKQNFLSAYVLIFFVIAPLLVQAQIKSNVYERIAKIENEKGQLLLYINQTPVYPMIYALTDLPGARNSWEELPAKSMEGFAKQGIRLFQVNLFLEAIFTRGDTLKLELVRKQIKGVLDIHPDANIIIRLNTNPSAEWISKNNDEKVLFLDTVHSVKNRGEDENLSGASFASQKWRDHTVKLLKVFCKEVSELAEAKALIGLHIGGGIHNDWIDLDNGFDQGKAMTAYFRNWLKSKYSNDKNLQKAWKDVSVKIVDVQVPILKGKKAGTDGIFRDPSKEQKLIDYYRCHQEATSESILLFCKTVKENWPRPLLTGIFYGYVFDTPKQNASNRHLQMEQILTSPFIDYLSGPLPYSEESAIMGGSGRSRGIIDACTQHGKLWLDEMDQESFLGGLGDDKRNIKTVDDNIALNRRNLCQAYVKGAGQWFYDIGPHKVSGWWNNAALLKDIGRLDSIFNHHYLKENHRQADVLFVYDTDVFYYLADEKGTFVQSVVETGSEDAYHAGIVFDEVLLYNLDKVDLKKYKAIVFNNTFYMTEKQRNFIKNNVAKDGRHIIWNYMPGYTDGKALNKNFVSDITGLKLEKYMTAKKPEAVIKTRGYPNVSIGLKVSQLVFEVKDTSNMSLIGFYKDSEKVAVCKKTFKDYTSWFFGVPLQNADLMRAVFKNAGVHIYNDAGDVIHAGRGLFMVHTKDGGKRVFTFPSGKRIETTLAPRSTRIFDLETGEVVLK